MDTLDAPDAFAPTDSNEASTNGVLSAQEADAFSAPDIRALLAKN